ncbi:hypothetical protein [Candidatus Pelagibacter sp. HIMB1748]|uniref:hypothetical protein n=1 Tax=unclassified Candidatus Pelagibacter TaxID=2647897 RepID=UPI003F85D0DA
MLGFTFYSLYKHNKAEKKAKILKIETPYLFVYRKDINKFKELNVDLDNNLKKLIFYLKNDQIDFIFVFFHNKTVIHSSGVSLKKNSPDKFFFEFQNNRYGVIGPTFTNPLYRGKQFYKYALEMQINNLINNHNINEIFISTENTKKLLTPFKFNNLQKFSSGLIISILSKLFIYVIYKKPFRIRLFLNDNIVFKFR